MCRLAPLFCLLDFAQALDDPMKKTLLKMSTVKGKKARHLLFFKTISTGNRLTPNVRAAFSNG